MPLLDLLSILMGDRLPSQYVTATRVDLAFYPPWDGKMTVTFWQE